jgi:2-C-methyl-D-erythritol 2,4-cyclodiphosphate synthase
MKASPFRIGHGYDIHRFSKDRPLVLGGVRIPADYGLEGHSDADAVTHAVCDALLGAIGLPDIGHFFPNTDERWRGVNSQVLLAEVARNLRSRGWEIGNIDVSVIAQKPKIAPYLDEMRATLAGTLGLQPDVIGIKATTNEKLGSLGRSEGLAAHSVTLIFKP